MTQCFSTRSERIYIYIFEIKILEFHLFFFDLYFIAKKCEVNNFNECLKTLCLNIILKICFLFINYNGVRWIDDREDKIGI